MNNNNTKHPTRIPSIWLSLGLAAATLAGCAGPRISPGTKLVDLAPVCPTDLKHDFQSVREDPESKFALEQAGAMGTMIGASAAAGAAGTVAAAAAVPLAVIPVAMMINASVNKERARYTGVVVRTKVANTKRGDYELYGTKHIWGLDKETTPPDELIKERLDTVLFEGGGGAYAQKTMGVQEGDIIDVKTVFGRYAEQRSLFSSYTFGSSDFNKHVVRISRVVCKHNDEACLAIPGNQIEGILCRHQQTEHPADEYLIPEDIVKQAIAIEKAEKSDNPWGI